MTEDLINTKIAVFNGKKIRKTIHNNEWWFSVVNICAVLTDSLDAGAYWRKLKQRLKEESNEVVTFCHGLKIEAADGKKYETDCANTEGVFRIIQSIPSPKAEPFKRWLQNYFILQASGFVLCYAVICKNTSGYKFFKSPINYY